MDYRYLGSIFSGPLTGVTIGYHPRCVEVGEVVEAIETRANENGQV
jgi:hypothetical protein